MQSFSYNTYIILYSHQTKFPMLLACFSFLYKSELFHTVYAEHLTVILIWRLGKFVFILQIKCMHCLHLSVSICDLDSPCRQIKYPPIYITYQFAILYVCQIYRVYGIFIPNKQNTTKFGCTSHLNTNIHVMGHIHNCVELNKKS